MDRQPIIPVVFIGNRSLLKSQFPVVRLKLPGAPGHVETRDHAAMTPAHHEAQRQHHESQVASERTYRRNLIGMHQLKPHPQDDHRIRRFPSTSQHPAASPFAQSQDREHQHVAAMKFHQQRIQQKGGISKALATSQLSFEYVKPHARTHLRTIPVQGYQRTRQIPASAPKATEATKVPSDANSRTEQAVAIAAQLDPNNMGVLVGSFQRAQAAGYSGRAAQNAASQLYWAMREGALPDQLKDLKAFMAATFELEQLLRPDLPHDPRVCAG